MLGSLTMFNASPGVMRLIAGGSSNGCGPRLRSPQRDAAARERRVAAQNPVAPVPRRRADDFFFFLGGGGGGGGFFRGGGRRWRSRWRTRPWVPSLDAGRDASAKSTPFQS